MCTFMLVLFAWVLVFWLDGEDFVLGGCVWCLGFGFCVWSLVVDLLSCCVAVWSY